MTTLNVYSDKAAPPAEVLSITAASYLDYIRTLDPAAPDTDACRKYSVHLNGQHLPLSEWATPLQASDVLDVYIEPKGDPVTTTMIVISVASMAMTLRSMNMLDNLPSYGDAYDPSADRSSIYAVNAQGNQVRLMAPVPEQFGEHKRYPDIISAPYYTYENHEQWLHLLLSLGPGQYDNIIETLKVGDTYTADLGADVQVGLLSPGNTITSHQAYLHKYTVAETSSPIELKGRLPEYTFPGEGAASFYWQVQAETTKIRLWKSTQSGTTEEDWRTFYENTDPDYPPLTGHVLEFIVGGNYEYYRVIAYEEILELQKLNSDFGVDQSWTGFTVGTLDSYHRVVSYDNYGAWTPWYGATPETYVTTEKLLIQFRYPNGLTRLDDRNVEREYTVTVEVGVRDRNNPATVNTYTFDHTSSSLMIPAKKH